MVCGSALFASIFVMTASAFGQCGTPVTISSLEMYSQMGAPTFEGETQNAAAPWSYHRGGPAGALLDGGPYAGGPHGWWYSRNYPYNVPCVGPIFSANAEVNEGIWGRQPSFDGLFMHPVTNVIEDSTAVFHVRGTLTISALSAMAEVLGVLSDGVVVTVKARKNGNEMLVAGPTSVLYTPSGHTVIPAIGGVLPLTLGAGDVVWINVSNPGNATEDWCSANLTMTVSGAPILVRSPRDADVCAGGTANMEVIAAVSGTASYRWQVFDGSAFVDLFDGTTASGAVVTGSGTRALSLAGVFESDEGLYRCRITNSCGTVTSEAGHLGVCSQDFDCDGFVTGADFDTFVVAFESGDSHADYDGDGFITGVDFDLYVQSFEEGC